MKSIVIYLKQAPLAVILGTLLAVLPNGSSVYATRVGERDMTQDRPGRLWQEGKERMAQGAPVGGPCAYGDIPGDALITSIEKTPDSSQQAVVAGGPGYEGFEVHYTFTPKAPITNINTQAWVERDHIIQLTNSWYPGPRYLEKYAVVKGKTLPAVLKVLSRGTCSPYVIDFPDLDLTDYFESTARAPGLPRR